MRAPYTLRSYQLEAVDAFLKAKRGQVVMVPGAGKTDVGLTVCLHLSVPTAICVPRIALVKQYEEWARKWNTQATGYFCEKKQISDLTVFVYNSAVINIDELQRFRLIIFDEAHHLSSPHNQYLLKRLPEYALGLTATPQPIQQLPVIYTFAPKKATQLGVIAPLKVTPIGVDMTNDERAKHTKYVRVMADLLDKYSRKVVGDRTIKVDGYYEIMRLPDSNQDKLVYLNCMMGKRKLLSQVQSKIDQVTSIVRKNSNKRILLFSESVDCIEKLKTVLNAQNLPCDTYHSYKQTKERNSIIDEWGKSFNTLLTVRCLDEGYDVPECGVGIIIASGQSERQITQRVGRLLRPLQGKLAEMYCVYANGTGETRLPNILNKVLEQK